ncbi:MAG: creatininase family protein, partial [Phycisphaerae bacterium]|nr:creatininase family protein [Phycisphaerae bacterium]
MQETVNYTDLRWPEIQAYARKGAIVLLPVGQIEEHGPHLPVGTDCHISTAVAEAVAKEASKELPVLVLPTLWTGYSGRDLFNWPG